VPGTTGQQKGQPMTPADPVSTDLKRHLRTLKLGQLLHVLPERLALARQQKLPHADFLELLLADEVTRRENGSAARRARAAGLDPQMRLETWDPTASVRYDQQLWNELVSLRFTEAAHGALILGPVGTGKTHLATALGHIGIRRRLTVHMARADQMFKRLKAARLDNTTEAEHRRLAAIQLLIIDDFALTRMDETATADFYELTVARHSKNATIVTSNRTPDEWLALMHDQLLAQFISTRCDGRAGQHEVVRRGHVSMTWGYWPKSWFSLSAPSRKARRCRSPRR
jgi:DNA replication protein DnaC